MSDKAVLDTRRTVDHLLLEVDGFYMVMSRMLTPEARRATLTLRDYLSKFACILMEVDGIEARGHKLGVVESSPQMLVDKNKDVVKDKERASTDQSLELLSDDELLAPLADSRRDILKNLLYSLLLRFWKGEPKGSWKERDELISALGVLHSCLYDFTLAYQMQHLQRRGMAEGVLDKRHAVDLKNAIDFLSIHVPPMLTSEGDDAILFELSRLTIRMVPHREARGHMDQRPQERVDETEDVLKGKERAAACQLAARLGVVRDDINNLAYYCRPRLSTRTSELRFAACEILSHFEVTTGVYMRCYPRITQGERTVEVPDLRREVDDLCHQVNIWSIDMFPELLTEQRRDILTLRYDLSKLVHTLIEVERIYGGGRQPRMGKSLQQEHVDEIDEDVVGGKDRAIRNELLEKLKDDMIVLLRSHQQKLQEKNLSSYSECLPYEVEFISDLKEISSRLSNIAQNCQVVLDPSPDPLLQADLFFTEIRGTIALDAPHGDSARIEDGDLVGIHHRKEKVIKLLTEDEPGTKLREIWITGETGLGKTTLVSKVCEDVRVRKRFDVIAWITICPDYLHNDFMMHRVLLQLALEMEKELPNGANSMNSAELEECIGDLLLKKHVLIILDDFGSFDIPSYIRSILPKNTRNSRIIITTTLNRHVQFGALKICEMKKLSEEESRALFCLKTFNEEDWGCLPEVIECCEPILKACRGVPEVIVLLSNLLRRKDKIKVEWKTIIPQVEGSLEFQRTVNVFSSFKEYNHSKKFAFLYLSIFPRNSLIDCRRFIRQWFAAVLAWQISESFSEFETDVGGNFIQGLHEGRVIEVVDKTSEGRIRAFRLNDEVRDIIVSMSEYRNIISTTYVEKTAMPEKIRHVGVQGGFGRLGSRELPQTVSLLVSDLSPNTFKICKLDPPSSGAWNDLLRSFHLLTILDLTGVPLKSVPDALFTLVLLTYLSLRDTFVESIPNSIGNLKYLLFLDLKGTFVSALPYGASKLEQVQHILIYHHERDPILGNYKLEGFKLLFPFDGYLFNIEKLCFVEADFRILQQLRQMRKLRRLGITKLTEADGIMLCSSICRLEELESLNIYAINEDEIIDLHHLSSPPSWLKRLYLHGRLKELPHWLKDTLLTKIVLQWSQLGHDIVSPLGELPNLVELNLCHAYNGDELEFKNGEFKKLEILILDELGRLISVSFKEGSMPSLKKVMISRCPWLEGIPSGVEHLPKVEELLFFDMPCEFEEMARVDIKEGDYERIKDKIHFAQWRPGHWDTTPFEFEEDGSWVTAAQTPSEYEENGGFGDEGRA